MMILGGISIRKPRGRSLISWRINLLMAVMIWEARTAITTVSSRKETKEGKDKKKLKNMKKLSKLPSSKTKNSLILTPLMVLNWMRSTIRPKSTKLRMDRILLEWPECLDLKVREYWESINWLINWK